MTDERPAKRGRGLDRASLSDEQRCVRIKANGERCKNPHLPGLTQCLAHSGKSPTQMERARKYRVMDQMRKLRIMPIDDDDPVIADPAATLRAQIRETWGWIAFCQDKITELDSDEALVYGRTTSVHEVGERDEAAVDVKTTTDAAAVHQWVERLDWNRKHLATLTKLWIDAGFEAARIAMEERLVDSLEAGIDAIVADLGLNPRDAAVRATIRRRLSEMSG